MWHLKPRDKKQELWKPLNNGEETTQVRVFVITGFKEWSHDQELWLKKDFEIENLDFLC